MISEKDTLLEIQNIAEEFLPALYDFGNDFSVKLLKYSENITFLLTDEKSGRKSVLRVNRPDYHNEEELRSEILWMNEISRDTTLILPKVYKGKNGDFLQKFISEKSRIEYLCCMFSFLEGKLVGELHGDELIEQIKNMGTFLAILHNQSYNRDKSVVLKRFSWDLEDLLGKDARWGDWHSYKELNSDKVMLFEKAVTIIRRRIEAFGRGNDKYGLIHADLHRSNIIVKDEKAQIFDFDDCGYGWYLYDLGCSLVEYSDGIENLIEVITAGYETIRTLSKQEKDEIDTFILLRRIVRMAWLSGHSDSDTAKNIGGDYFMKTCQMAEKYINDHSCVG